MPKPSQHEIEESYDRLGLIPDEEDEALIRHVMCNDEPRQGLHQHGDTRRTEVEDE